MKTILLFLLMAGQFLFLNSLQAQCLTNGFFAGGYNGWLPSNGIPAIDSYNITNSQGTVTGTVYYVSMSGSEDGSVTYCNAIFTPYTFQQYYTYQATVTWWSSGVSDGLFFVDAANGLTQAVQNPAIPAVDQPLATPSSSQLIGSAGGFQSTMLTSTFQFTANSNYSQLWIYPQGGNGSWYNWNVYSIGVCPYCPINVVDVDGCMCNNIVAGEIETTPATSGLPITNNGATGNITYIASTSIIFNKGVNINSAYGNLIAVVAPCNPANNPTSTTSPLDSASISSPGAIASGSEMTDSTGINGLRIFPTVSRGTVTLTGSLASLANANISVISETGQTMYQQYNTAATTLQLDLTNFPNGLYFVQIRQQTKVTTKKVIISH